MKYSAKLSVIVPIYGVEQYIEKCARSLFDQTLSDIEYIFVDDSSPDNSIKILESIIEEYPERKGNTKIIRHNNNKGLPTARKSGVKIAKGEYIIHCDSDDWVDLNLYEQMYETAKQNESDLVICNCKNTDGINYTITPGGHKYNVSDCICDMFHRKMWWSLCNKMFKSTLYDNRLIYPEDAMGEDMCLCLQLMKNVKNISYISDLYYN